MFEVNTVKDEIILEDHDFSEIVITTPNSKCDTQTKVEEFCRDLEFSKQSAHDSVENEIIEDPISVSNEIIHKDKDSISNPTKNPIQCTDNNLKSVADLTKHRSLDHEGKKSIPCGVCNAKFASKAHVKYHIAKAHDEIKPLKCETCGYKYRKLFILNQHIKAFESKIQKLTN